MKTLLPLERAIEICKGQTALASAIGGKVQQPHVWNWLNRSGGVVPAEYCKKIEKATKGKVTCSELRPDIWPEQKRQKKAA